jgi:phosphoribosylformylglycinamidine synthase subunit PurQ / glutaminase
MSEPRTTFGVVVFPGSNCDHDAYHVLHHVLNQDTRFLWHKNSSLEGVDVVVLPGGFSYGDYLRCGAIARFSPIMKEVIAFAKAGGVVIGICNGFQILCEAGLLPGSLLRNEHLTFVCKPVQLRVEYSHPLFTSGYQAGEVLTLPVAHGEGKYHADDQTLRELETNGRILFRYCDPSGKILPGANPNGSAANIAGIVNETGNVMGMMPHPERASETILGNTDGAGIFLSLAKSAGMPLPGRRSPVLSKG